TRCVAFYLVIFLNTSSPTVTHTLSLHDALPISRYIAARARLIDPLHSMGRARAGDPAGVAANYGLGEPLELPATSHVSIVDAERSEEHTSELQSLRHLVCRLLLEKKKQAVSDSR